MTRFIETHRERFGVEPICRELQVAPQAYYAARQRPRSARRIRDEALQVKLRQVDAEHFGVYGARQLTREGIPVGSLHRGAADAGAESLRGRAGEVSLCFSSRPSGS